MKPLYAFSGNNTINETSIDMTQVVVNGFNLSESEYFNFALQKAIAGGSDTFGIRQGTLFLGNYREFKRYGSLGRPFNFNQKSLNINPTLINRVYSVMAPKNYSAI